MKEGWGITKLGVTLKTKLKHFFNLGFKVTPKLFSTKLEDLVYALFRESLLSLVRAKLIVTVLFSKNLTKLVKANLVSTKLVITKFFYTKLVITKFFYTKLNKQITHPYMYVYNRVTKVTGGRVWQTGNMLR